MSNQIHTHAQQPAPLADALEKLVRDARDPELTAELSRRRRRFFPTLSGRMQIMRDAVRESTVVDSERPTQ